MSNLADFIEQYLRGILDQEKKIEMQRRELAKMFRCAPSQINYVLETRFTLERGFMIESKRGGGGYIRITQVQWRNSDNLPQIIEELIPPAVSANEAIQLFASLVEKGLLAATEAQLSMEAMQLNFIDLPPTLAGYLRSKFIKAILLVLGGKTKE